MNIQSLTLAGLAALTLAAGPAAAQSIHIPTAGKTSEQVQAEIVKAAARLCSREVIGASFPAEERRACVAQTLRQTAARSDLKVARR